MDRAGPTPTTRAWRGVVGVVRNALLAAATIALLAVTLAGVALLPVAGLGVPVLLEVADLVGACASWQRRQLGRDLGVTLSDPEPPVPADRLWPRLLALGRHRPTWREVAWLAWQSVAGPAAALAVVIPTIGAYTVIVGADDAVSYLILGLPAAVLAVVAILVAIALDRVQAIVSRRLLADPTERSSASARIEELTRTRATTVDAQAAELRRIERDLHDGVQARLVSLGLAVGMARAEVRRSPDRAEELLDDVATTVGATLGELRALVRGIHPPVLAERGLPAALEALTLIAAVPVDARIEVADRFDAPVESALYFAGAEILTNVSRHAAATHAELALTHVDGWLTVSVTDDGRGGADPADGTGLRGIRDRIAAFDGTITVTSPPGGPTQIRVEVPCAPSSPRTRHCSATASPGSSRPTTSP